MKGLDETSVSDRGKTRYVDLNTFWLIALAEDQSVDYRAGWEGGDLI